MLLSRIRILLATAMGLGGLWLLWVVLSIHNKSFARLLEDVQNASIVHPALTRKMKNQIYDELQHNQSHANEPQGTKPSSNSHPDPSKADETKKAKPSSKSNPDSSKADETQAINTSSNSHPDPSKADETQGAKTSSKSHLYPSKADETKKAKPSSKSHPDSSKADETQAIKTSSNSHPDPSTRNTSMQFPLCPIEPPDLVGRLFINVNVKVDIEEIVKTNPQLQMGGFYSPPNCQPRDKVAIIIPFRNRHEHLRVFLHYNIPVLRRQLIQFKIYVIEQAGNCPFNRGMLLNIGALEAVKENDWQCYCFHDVDMIMEDDRNLYTCPDNPTHLSTSVDVYGYKLLYATLFGATNLFSKEQFWKINGYSNEYWGWGGEDDDAYKRLVHAGMKLVRPDRSIARYKMIRGIHHVQSKANPARFNLLARAEFRMRSDGLNNVNECYEVADRQLYSLYTKIIVELKDHVKC